MRHQVHGRHLGRDTAHRVALYRNLVTDLLRYERITTTEAKAKEIRPMAERIITLGRRGDLHARRQAQAFLYDTAVVKKVFDDIGPRMRERPGGYLRITGIEPRKGDGARMASIELVDLVEAAPTPRPQRVTAAPRPSAASSWPAAAAAPVVEAGAIEEAIAADEAVDAEPEALAAEAAAEASIEAAMVDEAVEAPEAEAEAGEEGDEPRA